MMMVMTIMMIMMIVLYMYVQYTGTPIVCMAKCLPEVKVHDVVHHHFQW